MKKSKVALICIILYRVHVNHMKFMSKPKIAIAALGGTISMLQNQEASQGVKPQLTAQDLIAAVPQLASIAEIRAQTIASVASAYIRFEHVLACLDWAHQAVQAGAQGLVITQGTDSLEETAFLLDLLWPHPEPIILMGAMRSPQALSADGPANLYAAVLAALAPNSRQRGVMVLMNDSIFEARWVHKAHATNLAAFSSWTGAAGMVLENAVHYFKDVPKRQVFARPPQLDKQVLLWTHSLDENISGLAQLMQSDHYAGVVLAGMGSGHCDDRSAKVLHDIAAHKAVVMASRTGAGSTTLRTYGYEGAEIDLQSKGVIMAQWLAPLKARLLLTLLLSLELPLSRFSDYQASLVY
ncbi:asparaginase [Brackiella oedipodis]|uniref:asparaginase n=1 Tax=Brackiella oedipodis TaxID=124225 RepID=UPI000687D05C|nr:asparaginase [Brackiella oedipodis]